MTKYKNSGYEIFEHDKSAELKASREGYCVRCFHTYWKKEVVVRAANGYVHCDCLVALADKTPRKLSPGAASVIGELDKTILKRKAKKAILANRESQQ